MADSGWRPREGDTPWMDGHLFKAMHCNRCTTISAVISLCSPLGLRWGRAFKHVQKRRHKDHYDASICRKCENLETGFRAGERTDISPSALFVTEQRSLTYHF
jgi:hypothetical protein